MQPMKYVADWLDKHADSEHCLFTRQDLRALRPNMSNAAFNVLLSRIVLAGHLDRICRGIYIRKKGIPPSGLVLFRVAALMRAEHFNYISLETVLSDAGVISQIPMNRISIMSSGRRNVISCAEFGTIEFVHTSQKPNQIMGQLSYDEASGLWRASIPLALRDMRATRRNCDLINWDIANEFI